VPGWRVVSWDAEQGLALTLQKGDAERGAILMEFEDRDDARDCFARTRRFNVCARRLFDRGAAISDDERRVLEAVVNVVRAVEMRLPMAPPPAPDELQTGAEVREILVERALIPESGDQYYFNPYMGCMIGCSFCYVA